MDDPDEPDEPDDEFSLFPLPGGEPEGPDDTPPDEALLERLRSFFASIANDRSAVIRDPRALQMARDLAEVFADNAGLNGLTKAEAEYALARLGPYDQALFDSRFTLFIEMGLITPSLPKKHQQRYVLEPSGMAGLLAVERLGKRGGVDEMLLLLDRTRSLVTRANSDRGTLVRYLNRCRQLLMVYAAKLARLVGTAPIHELIAEHRNHNPARVERDVHTLNLLVSKQFRGDHELGDLAFRLVEAELVYREQVYAAVARVLDQGGASLDFTVLPAETYLTAAREATLEELATVGAGLVVDPPMPWTDPGSLLEAIEDYRPRARLRARPPVPTEGAEDDPIGVMRARHEKSVREKTVRAEQHLQGANQIELTGVLRSLRWDAAAVRLMELLALSSDPDQPFVIELGQLLMIDTDGSVTYIHPVILRRLAGDTADGPGSVPIAFVVVSEPDEEEPRSE
ncbi:hypothetical protein LFM09_33685 [Lentzea alba]|uniref:hypothetical protein n=1 Tax=Lentzea alba TaxID=2714351 RepID=UPI0039BEFEFF